MFRFFSEIFCIFIFLAILFIVDRNYDKRMDCATFSEVRIVIEDSSSIGFISKNNIKNKIESFKLIKNNTLIKEIELDKIKSKILDDIYINKVDVSIDMYGILKISIGQLIPKLRVITDNGISFFIDDKYKVVRRRNYMALDVPILTVEGNNFPLTTIEELYLKKTNGNININEDLTIKRVDNLIDFCSFIDNDNFWSRLIVQINLNKNNEIELIPRIGEHIVIMCNIDSLSNYNRYLHKLNKLYKSEDKMPVFSKYKKINLKYGDLIVCTKRDLPKQ